MKTFDGECDRRQRVNLSDDAFDVVTSDRFTFAWSGAISYSEIICRIFLMFVEWSAAKKGNWEIVERLLAKKPSCTQRTAPSMRNGVIDYLSDSDVVSIINRDIFRGSPGRFIKAVIEEYAEKPFIERERIYFADFVGTIESGSNKPLRVVTGSTTFIVKPYKIMADKHSTYNYLVCNAAVSSKPDKYEISSFRISRIKEVTILDYSDLALSEGDIENIKKAISEKGVPFLRGNMCNLVVELTDKGKHLFNSLALQRPQVVSADGGMYRFKCTERQAEVFFFRLGGEAKIVEPVELREKFANRYRQAAEKYNN